MLNRGRVDLEDDVVVLGCTLHSHVPSNYTKLTNDFEYIHGWSVVLHNAEHALDKAWLKDSLARMSREEPGKRVVVATHYAPSFQGTRHPEQAGGDLSSCFCSGVLEEMVGGWEGREMVGAWVRGHTHWCARFEVPLHGRGREGKVKVLVVSNQRWGDAGRG